MTTESHVCPLAETEIQLLIALIELSEPITTPNNNHYSFFPKSLEEAGNYFRGLRQDWSEAYLSLRNKGLLTNGNLLTTDGCATAKQMREARPPIYYWYQEANRMTENSPAYDRFCQKLYGQAFCQYNFSDTGQLDQMLAVLNLSSRSVGLDLGCAKGYIAEYFSDKTGANFTGIDYSDEAIRQAVNRTQSKNDRLHFEVQNMDDLDFPDSSFDAVISIDTFYMPNDLEKTLRKVLRFLKPAGQIAAFYTTMIDPGQLDRSGLFPQHNQLGSALRAIGIAYSIINFSEPTYQLLQRKHQLGLEMKADFDAENHLALWKNIMDESESSPLPYNPATCNMTRYLYHARIP